MFMYDIINLVNKRGRKIMILNTIKIKGKEVYLMTDINTGQFKWTKKKVKQSHLIQISKQKNLVRNALRILKIGKLQI